MTDPSTDVENTAATDDRRELPSTAEYVPDAEADDGLILDEQPYQVMEPLDADEYKQLKNGIQESGILDPIHVTPDSHIIDGHHRVLAWREIERDTGGLDKSRTPGYIVHGGSDDDTPDEQHFREKAWNLNMQQRHLDDGKKKDAIERRLKELDAADRRETDYAVAETLGVSASWVREVRHRLEGRGSIRTAADITTDTDGRRTQEDADVKRAAVREAIMHDPTRSNRDIARELDVSHPFVGGVRDEMRTAEMPQRFSDDSIDENCRIYTDQTRQSDVWITKTAEPEGWWVRLRERDFYDERDLIGRGLNEGWVIASQQVESELDAVRIAEEFAQNPRRYADRKARQLRKDGYEFEHTDLRKEVDAAEIGGEA